jgi:hypothetical protein|nr:MAG TPA: hypothetical protein [Caudoviricetes sp.]
MAKKKRYTLKEVYKLMEEKLGETIYICETNNYSEPMMRYRVDGMYHQTLVEIVDRFHLDD